MDLKDPQTTSQTFVEIVRDKGPRQASRELSVGEHKVSHPFLSLVLSRKRRPSLDTLKHAASVWEHMDLYRSVDEVPALAESPAA